MGRSVRARQGRRGCRCRARVTAGGRGRSAGGRWGVAMPGRPAPRLPQRVARIYGCDARAAFGLSRSLSSRIPLLFALALSLSCRLTLGGLAQHESFAAAARAGTAALLRRRSRTQFGQPCRLPRHCTLSPSSACSLAHIAGCVIPGRTLSCAMREVSLTCSVCLSTRNMPIERFALVCRHGSVGARQLPPWWAMGYLTHPPPQSTLGCRHGRRRSGRGRPLRGTTRHAAVLMVPKHALPHGLQVRRAAEARFSPSSSKKGGQYLSTPIMSNIASVTLRGSEAPVVRGSSRQVVERTSLQCQRAYHATTSFPCIRA